MKGVRGGESVSIFLDLKGNKNDGSEFTYKLFCNQYFNFSSTEK